MYAIILAGGEGTRLRPHTNDKPKPMVLIDGKPILEHQVHWLKPAGVTNIIFAESYMADVIQNYFNSQKNTKLGIYIDHLEDPPIKQGSVGSVRQALSLIPKKEKDVFVMAGDVLTETDPRLLLNKHEKQLTPLTIYTTPFQVPLGIIQANEFDIITETTDFNEKPKLMANSAIGVIRRNAYSRLPETGGDFFGEAAKVYAGNTSIYYDHQARWWHITDSRDLQNAERDFVEIRLKAESREAKLKTEPHSRGGKERI